MQHQFDLLKATRALILKTVGSLSIDEVNIIPANFNNSIAWNVVHTIVTQQLLHYGLSENQFKIKESWIDSYRKGTKPNGLISLEECQEALQVLTALPEILETDYQSGVFQKFKVYPTSYGYTLHNIEEAIAFNNAHEALHLGYIMALKKAI